MIHATAAVESVPFRMDGGTGPRAVVESELHQVWTWTPSGTRLLISRGGYMWQAMVVRLGRVHCTVGWVDVRELRTDHDIAAAAIALAEAAGY